MPDFPFTHVVITAANETQAIGYRTAIADRRRIGLLPHATFEVIPDPNGVRVGSGAATVHSIRVLQSKSKLTLREFLRSSRVLILHSGGDSKRLPAYAAQGKLFLPVPQTDDYGTPLTLFDVMLKDMESLNIGDRGRVVIAAGDLHLNLSSGNIDLPVANVVGISCLTSAETGTRHGVYVLDREGVVKNFLQKPSIHAMQRAGAISDDGLVHADTGVVGFSPSATLALIRASEKRIMTAARSGRYPFDLYEHIMIAIAGRISSSRYAKLLGRDPEHCKMLRDFFESLPAHEMQAVSAEHVRFAHVGSTREVLERLGLYFAKGTPGSQVCMNSVLGTSEIPERHCVIDSCVFTKRATFGGRNLVVGVPSQLFRHVSLPKGIGLVFLPIGHSQWTVIAFGDRDDFKTGFDQGGTLLNKSRRGDSGSAWDAPHWHVGTLDDAFLHAMAIINGRCPKSRNNHSIASLMPRVNHARLLEHRIECIRASRVDDPSKCIHSSIWLSASELANAARDSRDRRGVVRKLLASQRQSMPLTSARTLYAAATITRRDSRNVLSAQRLDSLAFEAVKRSVDSTIQIPTLDDSTPIARDQTVLATSPARIDLFGGWSDTPPICAEVGGAVVNAAVLLNGQYPLQAICRKIDEPHIRISSIDLEGSIIIKQAHDFERAKSPLNWIALPVAALAITGFRPPRGVTLRTHLEQFGGGLDITVFSALPKGSGLGASSILGATLIGALLRVAGHTAETSRLIGLTSALEQSMSTGGGWQDQSGGITPGVKLLKTEPGPHQIPTITRFPEMNALTTDAGASRCILYYTGRTRLAKNILRSVIGRYLAREREVRGIIERLKSGAHDMACAIESRDTDHCGRLLSEYWSLKKRLDPGSTNPEIEALFEYVKPHVAGGTLLGAGGGGFALFVAKGSRATARLRDSLDRARGTSGGRIYDFTIDHCGLNISVL